MVVVKTDDRPISEWDSDYLVCQFWLALCGLILFVVSFLQSPVNRWFPALLISLAVVHIFRTGQEYLRRRRTRKPRTTTGGDDPPSEIQV